MPTRSKSKGASKTDKSPPKPTKKVKESEDFTMIQDIAHTLRIDSIRSVNVTKSGHPTSCSSIAEVMAVLFFHPDGLKLDPANPSYFLNDRIVLSKGHAAPILYSAFYRAGVINEAALLSLRTKGSIIEGHPVPKIPFVDIATGSLGQGLSVACGMAYSSKYFDKIDNKVYCITGDGQIAEGSIWEAADFASHKKLNNLIAFIDVNRLGQSQQTMDAHQMAIFSKKFAAFGWHVISVDGHSIEELVDALRTAHKEQNLPVAIICKTFKGKYFTEEIENKLDWHGKDLGGHSQKVMDHLKSMIKHPNITFTTNPPTPGFNLPAQAPVSIKPQYTLGTNYSTRKAYGNALLRAHQSNPNVVGLDGDTKNSTFAITLFNKHPQAFVECFIAQQNMIGVASGLACRNKIPFCSTFASFLIRGADQIRIAGLSGNKLKMVGSHSGCSIGQDGPSQMALTIPKCLVLVPSDAVSTERAVQLVANYNHGPAFIRTARPEVPVLFGNEEPFAIGKCKILKSSPTDQAVVIACGVPVHEAFKAVNELEKNGVHIRLIDIFSVKPLDEHALLQNIAQCHGRVLVAEQHYPEGGLFDAVMSAAGLVVKKHHHVCVRTTPGSATPAEQLEIQGLHAGGIAQALQELLK